MGYKCLENSFWTRNSFGSNYILSKVISKKANKIEALLHYIDPLSYQN